MAQTLFRRALMTACSVLIVGVTVPRAEGPDAGIPLTLAGGVLPAVPVRVNGQGPFLFLLDTGGRSTILSSRLATRLGLAARARTAVDTVAGSTTAIAGRLDSLTLGSVTWTQPEVIWMALAPAEALDGRLAGVLGLDLLSRVDFVLDNRHRSLTIVPAAEADGRMKGTKTPLRVLNGRFGVTARPGGGTSPGVSLILDSAAQEVVLFDSAPARTLRAYARPLTAQVVLSSHAGSRVAPLLHLPSLTIDRLSLTNLMIVDVRDPAGKRLEDGLLPTRFFDRVYFAPTAGYVILDGEERS